MVKEVIVEKKLGIPSDYQYKALRSGIWFQRNWHRNKLAVLRSIIEPNSSAKVLNLGTGSGNFEISFNKYFGHLTGVDYNDEALSFLNKYLKTNKVKNVKLIQANIKRLPKTITSKKYDLVVIVDTIEHVKIEDANRLIKKVKRMLKKGGEFVVITPNYKSLWLPLEIIMDKLTIVPKFDDEQHLSKFDTENLVDLMKKAGYSLVKSYSFNLFSFLFPVSWLNDFLLKVELKYLKSKGCLTLVSGRN